RRMNSDELFQVGDIGADADETLVILIRDHSTAVDQRQSRSRLRIPYSPSVLPSDVRHGSSETLPRVLGLSVDLAAAPGRRKERGQEAPPGRLFPTACFRFPLSFPSYRAQMLFI